MSDFRSLLSSFQVATGSKPTTTSTSSSARTGGGGGGNNGRRTISLAKKIESLWRKSKIEAATRKLRQQHRRQYQDQHQQKEQTKEKKQLDGGVGVGVEVEREVGDSSSSSISDTVKDKSRPIHIAVCATIVSSLPQEAIWRSWISHTCESNCTASFHVHAKAPSAIPNGSWLKSKLIPVSHNPNWNDIRVVQAMLSLAKYALEGNGRDSGEDKNGNGTRTRITHILYITESCIPISTMGELAAMIREKEAVSGLNSDLISNSNKNINTNMDTGLSFVDAYGRDSPRCSRFDEHACFNVRDVPGEAIHKALPGWSLLSAHHVRQILNIPNEYLDGEELYPLFKNVWAPEEVFFPTALALLGKLQPTGSCCEEVVNQSVMWAKWDDRARGKERAHPIVYDGKFSKRLVQEARSEGCYFMRKYKKRLDVRDWERICLPPSSSQSLSPSNAAIGRSKRCRDDANENDLDERPREPGKKHIKTS